jgi:hypothetical protein
LPERIQAKKAIAANAFVAAVEKGKAAAIAAVAPRARVSITAW